MNSRVNGVVVDGSQDIESGLLKAKGQPARTREEIDGKGADARRKIDESHCDRRYLDDELKSGRPQRSADPQPSSSRARAVMRGTKGRDTVPEIALRRAVHALGLRYRVGVRPVADLRRTADLVFSKAKVAVFLDGCFWHGCPQHYIPAQKNAAWWADKIDRNRSRDLDTTAQLVAQGWTVLRFWEHEDPQAAAQQVEAAVCVPKARD